MKTLLIFSSLFLLSSLTFSQRKINYGAGLEVFQSTLNNIDREGYDGSGPFKSTFNQKEQIGWGATFLAEIPLNKNFSFETGLGVTNFHSRFLFDQIIDTMTPESIHNRLNVSLYYLKIPLLVSYNFPLSPKSSLHLSLGVHARFLLWSYDNYNDIIRLTVKLPKTQYTILVFSPQAAFGYTYNLKNNNRLRLETFAGWDAKKIVGEERRLGGGGFYRNLSTAYYAYYGMSLKYFFTH